jgi:hypothetical protein
VVIDLLRPLLSKEKQMKKTNALILTIEDVRKQVSNFLVDYLIRDPENTREIITTGQINIPCLTKDEAGDKDAIDYFVGIEWFSDHLLEKHDADIVLIQYGDQMIMGGCRELLREQSPIIPEVHGDDFKADFDALEWFVQAWFVQASDDEILALAKIGWGGNSHTNELLRNVNEEAAMAWIKKHRPSLYEKIMNL